MYVHLPCPAQLVLQRADLAHRTRTARADGAAERVEDAPAERLAAVGREVPVARARTKAAIRSGVSGRVARPMPNTVGSPGGAERQSSTRYAAAVASPNAACAAIGTAACPVVCSPGGLSTPVLGSTPVAFGKLSA